MLDRVKELEHRVYNLIDDLTYFKEDYEDELTGEAFEALLNTFNEADGMLHYLGLLGYEIEKERGE